MSSQDKIRVLIVEDSGLFRELLRTGLASIPKIDVVGCCSDGPSALEAGEELRPDVVLMDIELGNGPNGIQTGLQIRAKHPNMGIVLLSQYADKQYVSAIPKDDVKGWSYLLKDTTNDVGALVRAIEASVTGQVMIDSKIVRGLVAIPGSPVDRLRPRCKEVLELMSQGYSNPAIGEKMGISTRAVEHCVNEINHELGIGDNPDVDRRVQAVLSYLEQTRKL